ncbi:MAG TPA: 30S ribosome-binding factor RbfA [Acidimicrobiia bacterium]|nr:30S ribosome-binding factor RbfA [Acidimicrobiia bacterium]
MSAVARHGSPRRYPRTARVNEVVHEALADELERLSDPRLELVTITGVEVSPDLRHATVYYAARDSSDGGERGEQTRVALRSAAPHLRSELGRQVRLKYLPELVFREDPAIREGERVEAIIRELHEHDRRTSTEGDA